MSIKILSYSLFFALFISLSGIHSALAQCSGSDISVSYSSKCLPALVSFYVSPALPKGSVYYWDLGDGNGPVLGADTFYHQYTSGGSYGVTATVLKPDGTKCIITKPSGFVYFDPPLKPGFVVGQTYVCSLPTAIRLTDTTRNSTARDWYINGVLYQSSFTNFKFNDSVLGYTSISLIVYNNSGCPQTITKQNVIYASNLPLDFSNVLTENAAQTQITAKFSIDFDTTGYNITQYNWSFPGGNPSSYTGMNPPQITYSNLSSFYDVTLSATTRFGCTVSYTKPKSVGNFYSINKTSICVNDSSILKYVAQNILGRNNYFFLILRDYPNQISYRNINSLQRMVIVQDTGSYNFRFLLYRNLNSFDTLILPHLITAYSPMSGFSISPGSLCKAPGKIDLHVFKGNSVSGSNTFTWEILDSAMNQLPGSPIGPMTATDTSFTINNEGVYSIQLIGKNSNGCSDTLLKKNLLRIGTPDIKFKLIHDTLCVGDTLYVNNLSKMKDAPGNPLKYYWTFTNTANSSLIQTSNQRSPRIVFSAPGVYGLSHLVRSGNCDSSIFIKNAVYVNGVSAKINLTGTKTCPPDTYNLSASIISSVPNNAPLTYSWAVSPSSGATILNPSSAATKIVFSSNGSYSMILKVSNGGCTTTIRQDTINIGTIASFSIDSVSCRNSPIHPSNKSLLSANRFKWSTVPASGSVINNDTLKNPTISFTNSGCYRVVLQTSDSAIPNCFDTISKPVCIFQPPVVNNAYSPDSSGHCSPRIDTFYASAVNAKSFFWDFGDSTTIVSNDSQITHAYFKNNSTGYTVKVVAKDANGCASDTFVLKNYIKISGPEPSFSIVSKPPCDSGTVFFVNNSKFVYNYYFIYGDNSNTDYNTIKPHFYQFEDFSKDSNTYNPTLYAYDETGCLASATAAVKLYRPPVIKISASDTIGCAPLTITFQDSTKYASKYSWDFSDGSFDTAYSPVHVFKSASIPGTVYKVTLTAITDKGCSGTSSPISILVHPSVVPSMTITAPPIQCYQDSFYFFAASNPDIVRYHWDFGDGALSSDTSSLQNPSYHYTYSGKHKVVLTGYTKYGCTAQVMDSNTIQNLDSVSPVAPKIDYVTVTPTNQVEIVFAKSVSKKFDHYTIYRYPDPDSIYATSNVNDTVYYDNPPTVNVQNQSYEYTVKLTDICGFVSTYSIPHHSILLTVNKVSKNQLGLVWNKYTGWDSVRDYKIYRKDSKGKLVLIATVGPQDSTYLDTSLCPGRYTYYVYAENTNGLYFSTSDTASNSPDYQYQNTPIVLAKATVLNNKFVFVNWNPTIQSNFKFYSIDRYSVNTGWVLNFASTTKTFYIDSSLDVNNNEYIYRVSTVDDCGDVSTVSNIGTSILLKGIVINDTRYLSWNAYSNWSRGVASYHLQIIRNDGTFKDLLILPSTDTSYFDSASHQDLDVETCYRVYAVENPDLSGNIDSSLSNIACPNLPPRIYIPNAFSPNNDSVNDVFIPRGLSIINNTEIKAQKYEFRIYNKWGELMFETEDTRKGWDGKYNGAFAPPDVYIYTVDAQGFNGQRFYLKGNVTIVK